MKKNFITPITSKSMSTFNEMTVSPDTSSWYDDFKCDNCQTVHRNANEDFIFTLFFDKKAWYFCTPECLVDFVKKKFINKI